MGLEQWLGRVCQAEGSKPGKAHVEVGNLGAEYTRTVCGDSRAPSHLLPILPFIFPSTASFQVPAELSWGWGRGPLGL